MLWAGGMGQMHSLPRLTATIQRRMCGRWCRWRRRRRRRHLRLTGRQQLPLRHRRRWGKREGGRRTEAEPTPDWTALSLREFGRSPDANIGGVVGQRNRRRALCFNFENHFSTQRLRLRSTSSMASRLCKQCSSGKTAESCYKCSDGHCHCSKACMNSHGCVKSDEAKAKQVN